MRTLIGGAVLLTCIACAMPASARPVEVARPAPVLTPEQILAAELRGAIEALPAPDEASGAVRDGIARFYAVRNGQPVWLDRGQQSARAKALIEELGRAADWGLDPSAYAVAAAPGPGASPKEIAAAELAISLAAVRYARHAHSGRIDPSTISRIIDRGSTPPDADAVLKVLSATDAPQKVLLAYHPKHPQFERLRKKLIELRGGAQKPKPAEAVEVVIPQGPVLRLGMQHEQVPLLRTRLKAKLPEGAKPAEALLFDGILEAAVKDFQKANGLAADGLVGRGVRAALNGTKAVDVGPDRQVERILVNMERWRWIPEDLGEFYVQNNVPEFMQYVVRKGQIVRSERIIVGKGSTPTPTFSKRLEFIEFMPFWNVPNSIKVQEIGPGLARGQDMISVHNLRVNYNGRPIDPYSVDWASVDPRKFHFYQPPGGINVLGVVKFMFPNRFDTYMHDTPSKSLFNEGVRTISHGCMRVRNPLDLAEKILNYDQGWSMANVNQAVARGNNQVVLKKNVMVHVTYFTLRVEDDGRITTFGDIYGHDRRVALALNGATNLIADEDASHPAVVADAGPGLVDTFYTSSSGRGIQAVRERR